MRIISCRQRFVLGAVVALIAATMVTISGVAHAVPPIAVDDEYSMSTDTELRVRKADGVLVNDEDPDGKHVRVVLVDATEQIPTPVATTRTWSDVPPVDAAE